MALDSMYPERTEETGYIQHSYDYLLENPKDF